MWWYITGLGVCSPLGTGVLTVWKRLLDGITSLPEFQQVPSQVAGFVPRGNAPGEFQESDWMSASEKNIYPYLLHMLSAHLPKLLMMLAGNPRVRKTACEQECLLVEITAVHWKLES